MKKLMFAALATGLLSMTGTAVFAAATSPVTDPVSGVTSAVPGSGIKYTRHDLSSSGLSAGFATDEQDRICIYCHAPHHTVDGANAEADGVYYYPLWNHEITIQFYDLYSNGPNDPGDQAHDSFAEETALDVGSVSRLCLSCHDGTVAANQFGYAPSGSTNPGTMNVGDQYLIGGENSIGIGNLQNHHPVGFSYGDALLDENANGRGELAEATATMGSTGYTIGDLLDGGNMECNTCHDVHNSQNQGEKFLWISDNGSALCLTCHLK